MNLPERLDEFNILWHVLHFSFIYLTIQIPEYSWPLNNMDLNCLGPLTCGFFFNSKYCSTPPFMLVESADEEPWVRRDLRYVGQSLNYTWIFDCEEGPCPYPVLFKGPLYSEKHLSPSLPVFLPSGAGVSSLCFRRVLQRYVSINHIHHCFECF